MFGFKVGFVIAGAQKGGTTSLHAYLRQHPRLGMSRRKEVHFFDLTITPIDPLTGYVRYHRYFPNRADACIYGEATPAYLYWSDAMKRLWNYNPAMKIIALLRNPVERAYSHWNMERRRGAEPLTFSQAIRCEAERVRESLPLQNPRYSYIDRGLYSEQIRRTLRFFPVDQCLFIKSEEFFGSTNSTLDRVTDFLDVPRWQFDTSEVHNHSERRPPIDLSDRIFLADVFERDIAAVEKLLSWDCADWLPTEDDCGVSTAPFTFSHSPTSLKDGVEWSASPA